MKNEITIHWQMRMNFNTSLLGLLQDLGENVNRFVGRLRFVLLVNN